MLRPFRRWLYVCIYPILWFIMKDDLIVLASYWHILQWLKRRGVTAKQLNEAKKFFKEVNDSFPV